MAARATKAELQERLEAAQERAADLERRLAQAQAGGAIPIAPGAEAGYLVTTPLPFSGVTAGVRFRGGRAFLPKVPEAKPPRDPQADPEAQARYEAYVRQRELLVILHSDFGYTVVELDATGIAKLRREQPPETEEAETLIEKLSTPHMIGR